MGRHNIDIGYHGERCLKVDVNNLFEQPGQFTFNSNNTGDAIASYLFGYLGSFVQASGQFFNARGKFQGAYVQDSWKFTRNLTLDYGVRYEPFMPWHEVQGRMGSFFPNAVELRARIPLKYPLAPAGRCCSLAIRDSTPMELQFGLRSLHMPRLGFALDVFGFNGKTEVCAAAPSMVLRQPYQQHSVQYLLEWIAVRHGGEVFRMRRRDREHRYVCRSLWKLWDSPIPSRRHSRRLQPRQSRCRLG